MSGAGRKSKFRKSVTNDFLTSFPEPGPGERVCRISGTRGGNMFEIAFRDDDKNGSLALLPNKFRKMIWVKTRDFVIVEGYDEGRSLLEAESAIETQLGTDIDAHADADADTQVDVDVAARDKSESKIQYAIKHILTREQIKHLRKTSLWPEGLQAESPAPHPTTTTTTGGDSAGLGAEQPVGASAGGASVSTGRDRDHRDRLAMPDLPPRSADYGREYARREEDGAEEYEEYEEEEEELFYDKMGNTITREAAEALAAAKAKSSTAAAGGGSK